MAPRQFHERAARATPSFALAWAIGAAYSTVIEVLQHTLNMGRVASVDDVLVNAWARCSAGCSPGTGG